MQKDIEYFLNQYKNVIFQAGNEAECWKVIIGALQAEDYIDQKDLDFLWELLLEEDCEIISDKHPMTNESKESTVMETLRQLLAAREDYQKAVLMEAEEHGKDTRISTMEKEVYHFHEEETVIPFFENTRKYHVLFNMYKGKYDRLWNSFKDKVQYRKYSKDSSLAGDHYCYSPIEDLLYSNVQRPGLSKKEPEDIMGWVEYDYDADGRLIMQKHYASVSSIEFLLYTGEWIINLKYAVNKRLRKIILRKYEGDRILRYERASIIEMQPPLPEMCYNFWQEIYQYSEQERLEKAVTEDFYFWGRNEFPPVQLTKEVIIFKCDEEGCLTAFLSQIYDNKVVGRRPPCWMEVSERKRKSTKKTRGRWRRPNYFVR